MSSLKRKVEELDKEVKRLKVYNNELKANIFRIEKKNSLQINKEDFMSYKFRVNGRMSNLIDYITSYQKNVHKSDIQRVFLIHHCRKLVNEVFTRHPFSFDKEYENFIRIMDFLLEFYEEKEEWLILWDINRKLYKIYYLLDDEILKFETVYNCIYFCYKLGNIHKSKLIIRDMRKRIDLNKVCNKCNYNLQKLKNLIYDIK